MTLFGLAVLLVSRCHCFDDSLVRVSLFNTTFTEGRDHSHRGALGQFVSVFADLSKISITSRLAQKSFLFDCVCGQFSARDSEFEGLSNFFGHFSGGKVVLNSLSFKRCVRPVTAAGEDCSDRTGQGRLNKSTGDITVKGCTFVRCSSGSQPEGGAIWLKGGGSLVIDGGSGVGETQFINCTSTNGWGAAVFAQVQSFQCNTLLCEDISTQYSVLHIEHKDLGVFSDVKMSKLRFNKITIANTDTDLTAIQGGGSGLVIRYINGLELSDCSFTTCSFSGADDAKRAGALMFDRSGTSDTIAKLSLAECTFTATSGKTGCIYVNNPVTNFTINACTVERGGGVSDHRYSIYVNSKTPTITKLKMKNMDGGNGRIWLGGVTATSITFTGCEFRTYSTPNLFYGTGTNGIGLILSGCIFDTFKSLESNLFPVQSDGLSSLTISNCTFNGITAEWALIAGTAGTCRIDSRTSFTQVTIDSGQGQDKKEPILDSRGSGLRSLTLEQVSFEAITNVAGILDSQGYGNPTLSVSGVTFTNVGVDVADPKALFRISSGSVTEFDGCTFKTCSSTSSAILRLECEPTGGIKNCVFDGCSTGNANAPILKITRFTTLHLDSCTFRSMTSLKGPPVRVESSVTITGSVTFDNVRFESDARHALIEASQKKVSLNNPSVTVSGCHFSKLVSGRVDQATVTGTFRENQVDTLFDVSVSLTLTDSDFTGCTGQLITSGSLSLTECEFHNNTVSEDALIKVGSSLDMSGCCFQGTLSGLYLSISEGATVTPTSPLCFDRNQSECVSFSGEDPFENLTSQWYIFNCDTCGSPAPVEPTSPPESDDETSFVDETSFIDETSLIDETSDNEDSSDIEPSSPTTSGTGGDSGKREVLDGGAIAGIVIGILIIVAVIVVLLWFFVWRKKKEEKTSASSNREMNEETVDETATSFVSVDDWAGKTTEDNPLFTTGDQNEVPTNDLHLFEENWG